MLLQRQAPVIAKLLDCELRCRHPSGAGVGVRDVVFCIYVAFIMYFLLSQPFPQTLKTQLMTLSQHQPMLVIMPLRKLFNKYNYKILLYMMTIVPAVILCY